MAVGRLLALMCTPAVTALGFGARQTAGPVRIWARPQVGAAKHHRAPAAAAAALAAAAPLAASAAERWAYSELLQQLSTDDVMKVYFAPDSTRALAYDLLGAKHQVDLWPGTASFLIGELQSAHVPFAVWAGKESGGAADMLAIFAMTLPFLALFWVVAHLALTGLGTLDPLRIRRDSARAADTQTGVTFDDVAGCDASKLELSEIVEFLKNPLKFSALGAKIPRGVIMEGPPGTGKTLLARAVAGEAGVPFLSASGSEFVEMYVGVGAARVRDLFGKARAHQGPCIVFIDELDAVGKTRGRGAPTGGSGERDQTLNQILTEMDGFQGNQGIIVLAATNRADTLDAALLRPGRFDRRVPVGLPDVAGRLDILGVHARGKPLAPGVDLYQVAARTLGFSGASLANLLNEAAILAARRNATAISYGEIDQALDRLTLGLLRPTSAGGAAARHRLIAVHEAGHAVMGLLCDGYDTLSKVTIVPRGGGGGGVTLFTPQPDRIETGLYSLRHLKHRMAVALGGTVAEELFFTADGVTTGGADDLQQVRSLARRMVAQWGFAFHNLGGGPVAWESEEGNGPFAPRAASAETEAEIDAQVTKLVDEAYATCRAALTQHHALLEEVAEALIEEETLDAARMAQISHPHLRQSPAAAPAVKANQSVSGRKKAERPWRPATAAVWPKPPAQGERPRGVREPARVRRDKGGKATGEEPFGI